MEINDLVVKKNIENPKEVITIYADGAFRLLSNTGGIGIVMKCGNYEKKIMKKIQASQILEVELSAILVALQNIKTKNLPIEIYSDSEPALLLLTRKQTTKKEPYVKIIGEIRKLSRDLQIHYSWIRGHNGNIGNELADFLSKLALDKGDFMENVINN